MTITIISINGVISALTMLVSVASMMSLARYRRKTKYDSKEKIPVELYYAQMCFFLLCAADGLCRVPDIVINCYEFGFWWRQAFQFVYFTCYIYHWIALLAILFLRLKVVFHGSKYQVNPCYYRVSIFIAVFISVLYATNYVAMLTQLWPYSFVVMLAGIITFILLIYSQVLAFVFVRKLYRLNSMATRDDYLIAAMTRYTILGSVTIIGSVVVIFSAIALSLMPRYTPLLHLTAVTGQSMDILIDSVCIALSLNFYSQYYSSMCSCFDRRIRKCCDLCAVKTTNKMERQLAAFSNDNAQNNSNSRNSHTNTRTKTASSATSKTSADAIPDPPVDHPAVLSVKTTSSSALDIQPTAITASNITAHRSTEVDLQVTVTEIVVHSNLKQTAAIPTARDPEIQ